ncbi:hypothetical protein M409DRAFT_24915 [Zasmidium cellare ATCC 36951]|uniref:Cytochrome P450 n=1 Tax=Zasmidium cellare ATCC 36951 TaxID=1080233 RepID=A0A6A6CHV8_ZASCE|nr:uncharacterized protein M409DRAFT_24915 [Zasmidium cellare ATCC 36951]KAF2165016.1 hypothetical protein M409DRAFT_24915 [Zasmidium cellare ATCC 36951]
MDYFEAVSRLHLLHGISFIVYWLVGVLLAAALSLVAAASLIVIPAALIRIHQAPKNIPWAGLQNKKWFPKLRACLREMAVGRAAVEEGYEKYGKHGKAFIIPGLHWNAVVLPPSHSDWVARQPENVLSSNKVLDDTMGLQWLVHGPTASSVRDFTVLRRDMTRQHIKLSHHILDEIKHAFDEELGSGTEYHKVSASNLCAKISFRATNRMFVGLPLCRSEAYETDVTRWTTAFGTCTLIMRFLIPKSLKPLFMQFVALPTKLVQWRAVRFIRPRIRQRLGVLKHDKTLGNSLENVQKEKEPNDMLQWIINANAAKDNPRELEPGNIAGKMLFFNVFATGTTSTVFALILCDMVSHVDATALIVQLREEADQYMPLIMEDGSAARHMMKTDSVIRETLRHNPMGAQGLLREVVAPSGLTTPDGLHLPKGTHVQSVVSGMQRDVNIGGAGVDEYDPLRYWREAQRGEVSKQLSASQVSDRFLSFGLGKHACPGRFFAVNSIKLMLGHLLMTYDIEPLKAKPEYTVIGEGLIPSAKTMVRLRRRSFTT